MKILRKINRGIADCRDTSREIRFREVAAELELSAAAKDELDKLMIEKDWSKATILLASNNKELNND